MLHHRAVRRLVALGAVASLWIVAAGGGCAGGTEVIEDDGGGGDTTVATTAGGSGPTAGTGGVELPCGVDCAAIATPDCQVAQCNMVTMQCEVVNDEDGVACDDGVFCTISDSCNMGMCEGGPQNDCGMTPPACTEVTCDEMSQSCSTMPSMNGAPCQEPDLCIKGSMCSNGICLGGMLDTCFFEPVPDECHISECDSADGMCKPVPGNEGNPCTDLNDLCTINKTCMTGMCQGGQAMDCSHLTQNCDIGVCDTTNGMCTTTSVMNGQPCDDLNACTTGETCSNQQCINGTPVTNCSLTGDGCCPTNCNATNDLDCQIQPSCQDFKLASPGSQDGIYTIDPDGPGPVTPFPVWCDMTTDGGGWTECLSVQNTAAEELNCTTNYEYFNQCVDFTMGTWTGSEVMVQLVQGTVKIYSAWGTRANPWTYELLTSNSVPSCPNGLNSQYNRASQHPNTITLNTGEFLTISGRDSGQQGWGGSWGNGYMIVVQTVPSYASNNVVTVMTNTNSGCYNNCQARSFIGMSPSHEVMYGPGGTVTTSSNSPLTAADVFLGEFKFYVR